MKVFVELHHREERLLKREQALRERERASLEGELRLRSRVLESMAEGVSVADEDGILIYTNPAEDRMFGYGPGELLGQHVTVQNAYPPEENQRIVSEVIATLRARGEWHGEWFNKKKDGIPFFTRASITALDLAGKPHWVCVQEDITDEKRSAEQLRLITDSVPVLISYVDRDGFYRLNNLTYEKWFGHPRQEVTDRHMRDVLGEAAYEAARPYIEEVLAGRPVRYERELPYRDGGPRWVEATYTPYVGPAGSVEGFVVLVQDITERKAAEREREKVLRELAEAVRLRDEFLTVASHELKTPLTPLALRLTQLKQHAKGTSPEHQTRAQELRHVEVAESQVRKLSVLVDGLLDVSRLAHGKLVLHLEEVNVGEVVHEVAELLRPAAERANSPLEVMADAQVQGYLDRVRVGQIVTNLMSNAIKFGAGKPIQVNLERVDGRALFRVVDQGIGIPADALERVFNKFERAVSERNYGGLGLGLWLTREIVEAMGGTISVRSEPAQGATFMVELPLRARASAEVSLGGTVPAG